MAELVEDQVNDGDVGIALDRSLLKEEISLVALKTLTQDIAQALKQLKDLLLNRPRFSNVTEPPSNPDANTKDEKGKASKLILLNDKINSTNLENVTEEEAACLKSWLASHHGELVEYKLSLSYANYSYEEVLQRLLPSGVEIPSSFETIGHIAHLNLREAHLPYKFLIAQVMLDKFTAIKTVINKIGEELALFFKYCRPILLCTCIALQSKPTPLVSPFQTKSSSAPRSDFHTT
jgi:tRNA (guanine37-N1)-methyltransferase